MAEPIRTLEEARALLADYDALPDDLNARLNWPGYERLPWLTVVCEECRRRRQSILLGVDELRWSVQHGELTLEVIGYCPIHDPTRGDEDEDEKAE